MQSYLVKLSEYAEMDHVEAQIAGLVARLYPDEFATLDGYCARHRDYLDPVIGRFDREVQFYLAYLELTGRYRPACRSAIRTSQPARRRSPPRTPSISRWRTSSCRAEARSSPTTSA